MLQAGPPRQVRARNRSKASLNADVFCHGDPWLAFGTMMSCEPGMQRCAASARILESGLVNSPFVIVTGTLICPSCAQVMGTGGDAPLSRSRVRAFSTNIAFKVGGAASKLPV